LAFYRQLRLSLLNFFVINDRNDRENTDKSISQKIITSDAIIMFVN